MTNPRPGDQLRDDLVQHVRDNLKALLPDGVDPVECLLRIEKTAHILTMLDPRHPRNAAGSWAHFFQEPAELQVCEPLKYEGDPAVRALADRIGQLVQHMEQAQRRHEPGPTLAQRAANELVLGLQSLPDHNALRNAAWRALRMLASD